jgi:hypothetical protein
MDEEMAAGEVPLVKIRVPAFQSRDSPHPIGHWVNQAATFRQGLEGGVATHWLRECISSSLNVALMASQAWILS